MSKFFALVDTDAFVGRFYPSDIHHPKSLDIFQHCERENRLLVATSLVVAETATVLSHHSGQTLARTFLDVIERSRFPIIHIDENLQQATLDIFKGQETRGTSVHDCANVAVIRRFNIPHVFSFDNVYSTVFQIQPAS